MLAMAKATRNWLSAMTLLKLTLQVVIAGGEAVAEAAAVVIAPLHLRPELVRFGRQDRIRVQVAVAD